MAILSLTKIWVNLVLTGAGVAAYSSERGFSAQVAGDVRTYAGGRQRAITAPGKRRQFAFKLRDVSDLDRATLDAWAGKLVCVRDYRGNKYFGIYFDLSITERRTLALNDISMTLTEVSFLEGS